MLVKPLYLKSSVPKVLKEENELGIAPVCELYDIVSEYIAVILPMEEGNVPVTSGLPETDSVWRAVKAANTSGNVPFAF
jgi:hypothetical protein